MTHVTNNDHEDGLDVNAQDTAPGDEHHEEGSIAEGLGGYVLGLVLAIVLTAASFWAPTTHVVWRPAIPALLMTLAVAQMGVHLVFFLHVTSGPDHTNNVLALAFGVLIVALILVGSIWIMDNMAAHMPAMRGMSEPIPTQR
jgi:cytochrome o ubiquinol oxidase operon protein cyoD